MSIVADASVVLAWFFEETHTSGALGILKQIQTQGLLVPPLWWSELENGILTGERRARKQLAESQAFLQLIHGLPIETDEAPRHQISNDILEIGRSFQLTGYDSAYLELARRQAATLATFDGAMRRCASKLKLKILPA